MRPTPPAPVWRLLALTCIGLGQLAADPTAGCAQWRGELTLAGRAFRGPVGSADPPGSELDFEFSPQLAVAWGDGSHRVDIRPFARVDLLGHARTRLDLRDLAWTGVWDAWIVSAGMREVFWGVTESSNPVDILNQRSPVASYEGYEKLGQPMVSLGLARAWGLLQLTLLPGFREREFAGRAGNVWSPIALDEGPAEFESGAGRRHVDWAVRWSHTIGDVDLAVTHFAGTSREPTLTPGVSEDGSEIRVPFYELTHATGVELQWTTGAWLWKAEASTRTSVAGRYAAGVAGMEYAVADYLGLSAEFALDTRGGEAMTSFENDAYVGARLWLPDGQARVGLFVDVRSGHRILRTSLRKRLSDRFTAEVGVRWFGGDPAAEPPSANRQESLLWLAISTYF